ncbi:GDSL esterase/lipase 5-like [Eucalyptus grandis]|uniref:GDSL esterase/lipase 5-like n=1 Tax=Eucalyptus grandis TaxID=71139 RepID=UPI00052657C3|nr:GDSL esterase/lipase 5-like [Eucalyptus grandis]
MEDYVGMVVGNISTVLEVVDLRTQQKQFEKLVKDLRKKLGDEKVKRMVLEGIYMVSIGGNDYLNPVLNNPALFQSISMEDYVGMVVGNISTVQCLSSGLYEGNYSYGGMRGVREYSLCPNPEEYVFFDSYHPSERAYWQFAQLMWNGSWHTT